MSKENSDHKVEEIVVELLDGIYGLIDWSTIGSEVRKKKYSILAKRLSVVARTSKSIEELVENLIKQIAGDTLFISKEKSKKLKDAYEKAKSIENDVLEFLKNYPYLSTVLYASYVESGQNGGDSK